MRYFLFYSVLLVFVVFLSSCNGHLQNNGQPTESSDDDTYIDLHSAKVLTDLFTSSVVNHPGEVIWTSDSAAENEYYGFGEGRILTKLDTVFYYKSNEVANAITIFASYTLKDMSDEVEDCHACSPMLGYAVFKKKDNGWQLQKFQKQLERYGSFGKKGEVSLVQYGTHHFALDMSAGYFGQGYLSQDISFFDFEIGRFIYNREPETLSNTGAVDKDSKEAYEYSIVPKFIRSQKDYWDLKIEIKGTKPVNDNSMQKVNDIELHTYDNSKGSYTLKL